MFVTLSVAAMLSMAAYSGDAMDQTRTSFSNCIVDSTIENLDQKTAQNDFSAMIKAACQDERKAFHSALVKYEQSEGSSKKEAEEFAVEEIEMMIDDSVVSYAEHLEAKTLPVKEG